MSTQTRCAAVGLLLPWPAWAATTPAPACVPVSHNVLVMLIVLTYLMVLFVLLRVLGSLNRDGQRLQDALSESVTFHLPGGGTETRLVASSSRLIAMIGLVSILALFLACGCVLIWTLGTCNHLPDNLNDMVNYILSGASLFVPYGVNQLRRAASALGNPSP